MTGRTEEEKRPREGDTGKQDPDETSRPKADRRKPGSKTPEPPRLRGFDDWASF